MKGPSNDGTAHSDACNVITMPANGYCICHDYGETPFYSGHIPNTKRGLGKACLSPLPMRYALGEMKLQRRRRTDAF